MKDHRAARSATCETAKKHSARSLDPSDGHIEYSAVVKNFDGVPTMKYAANSPWQMLSVLAFNLMHGFEVATTAARRDATRKRGSIFVFETIHTLRFAFPQRAGAIAHPDGYATLDVGRSPAVAERFRQIDRMLKAA